MHRGEAQPLAQVAAGFETGRRAHALGLVEPRAAFRVQADREEERLDDEELLDAPLEGFSEPGRAFDRVEGFLGQVFAARELGEQPVLLVLEQGDEPFALFVEQLDQLVEVQVQLGEPALPVGPAFRPRRALPAQASAGRARLPQRAARTGRLRWAAWASHGGFWSRRCGPGAPVRLVLSCGDSCGETACPRPVWLRAAASW